MPPLTPAPTGFTTIAKLDQLRGAIAAAPPRSMLELFLAPGTVLKLGGRPLTVSGFNLSLTSDGEGATLDAQQSSAVLDVQIGARVWLHAMTLANGKTAVAGGAVSIGQGSATMGCCKIVNCSTGSLAGAILLTFGSLVRQA